MPTIYQATCSNCDHQSPMVSADNLALRATHPDGQDTFRILAHPGERRCLESMGINFEHACGEGRLVGVRRVVCDACSQINIQYSANVNEGCTRFFVAFVVIVLFCWFALPASVPFGYRIWLGWGLFFGFRFVINAILESKRWRIQNTLPELSCCEQCGGAKFHNLDSNKPMLCPICGFRAFIFESVGIS